MSSCLGLGSTSWVHSSSSCPKRHQSVGARLKSQTQPRGTWMSSMAASTESSLDSMFKDLGDSALVSSDCSRWTSSGFPSASDCIANVFWNSARFCFGSSHGRKLQSDGPWIQMSMLRLTNGQGASWTFATGLSFRTGLGSSSEGAESNWSSVS